jgi:two-component system OmpR family sensor kinase
MILGGLRRPRSIFAHTFLLVMGVVVAISLGTIALILLRPPPNSPPVFSYEVARLLDGKPVTARVEVQNYTSNAAPTLNNAVRDPMIELAVSRYLNAKGAPVRFVRHMARRSSASWLTRTVARSYLTSQRLQDSMRRELELYGPEGQFNPRVFGSFTAAAQQPDGRWRTVVRDDGDPTESWQSSTIRLIAIWVLIALPFAWLFSRRLARPIRALADSAEKIGRNQLVDPVTPEGPSEIRQAALALNDMQARLQRYIGERTSVVGAIAHDLRTPLSRLNFHLENAPEELKSKAAAEIAEMEAMIAATLEFVQNEGRRQPTEPIDLSLLVEGVIDDLTDLGHDATLVKTTNAVVRGDAVLLKRMFGNLILNAVSYGGQARVTVRKADHSVVVDIEDSGPGMAAADMERAFEPFYRAEGSRNRSTGGIGLGLAIVQTAARAHGGSVTLRNRPGGGLCASVTLPVE